MRMQLLRTLSPSFFCLLTLSVQHAAGLAVPSQSDPDACPPICLEILPSGYTPMELTSWLESECGYVPATEQPAVIDDLSVSFKKLGEGSEIAMCLCKNKGKAHRRQLPSVLSGNLIHAPMTAPIVLGGIDASVLGETEPVGL